MLAQVSLEFVAFVSVLIVILLSVIYFNSSFYIQITSTKNYNDAQSISDQIASEINMALRAGDGYSRAFYIPNKISNSLDYSVNIENYLVTLNWSGNYVQSVIMVKNVTGVLVKGENQIKNNGTVYVNQ